LPDDQKEELAIRYLSQGEMALLQGNLNALSCFETASNLDPQNYQIWHRQGLAFFEYGSEEGKEKALLLASKNFKIATQIFPSHFDSWVAWGNVLLQLGRFHDEHHYLLEAKEKYQRALELIEGQPEDLLAELYWDYGIVWSEIAQHSGEAVDLKIAIEAFQNSKKHQKSLSAEFLNDFGKAYLEMGLLVNDSSLYLQSIEYLQQSVTVLPHYVDGWMSLAEGYSQLYVNTLDTRYATKASDAYTRVTKLSPRNLDAWISWAQLLGESGKHNNDLKSLHLSIEKCARAAQLDREDPIVISQWVESLSYLGIASGRLDLLIEAEQKVIKATDEIPDDPDLWYAYGICMIAFGQYYEDADYYELAIEKLQYGLSIDRSDPELWHALALTHRYYAELTNNEDLCDRANRFFTKAIDLKPSSPALLFDAASSLLQSSEILDELIFLEQSIYHFESLLRDYKDVILHNPKWLFGYACALAWLGDFTEEEKYFVRAIEIFSHVLLIDPDFPRIHHRVGQCYTNLGHITSESEYYKRAIHFFRLGTRQDEENDQNWLDWGMCLIHLAHFTLDTDFMNQLYMDAEQKIIEAGKLGNSGAYYNLACLYSILGRTKEAMELIYKSLHTRTLPSIEELLEDDWLENLRSTSTFAQFLTALETKLQQTREE